MTRNPRPGFLSLALFGLIAFAILALAALLSSAMEAGGGMFVALIAGLVIISALVLWAGRFVVSQYVRWTEAHTKAQQTNNNLILEMARIGYLPSDGKFRQADRLPELAQPAQPSEVEIDPRHALLVNLCLLTIKSSSYGPTSDKLLTADDAQADRSGIFADRNNWDRASKYGQSIGLLYTKIGGPADSQGLKVRSGTVADLLVALHERDVILDSAVAALPGVVR